MGKNSCVRTGIIAPLTFLARDNSRHPEGAEDDIKELGRNNRFAVTRLQDVLVSSHDEARFGLRFFGEWHVDGHLVSVEVGIEGRTNERMKLDSIALDEDWLEGLDTEAVERRGAV